jgi:hypothetical protein
MRFGVDNVLNFDLILEIKGKYPRKHAHLLCI